MKRDNHLSFVRLMIGVGATLGFFLSTFCSETLAQGTVIFADTEFADADWNTTVIFQAPGVMASNSQQLSGGNPGAYRQFTSSFTGEIYRGNTQVHIHASSYDPVIEGAIAHVVFTISAADFSNERATFSYGRALEQGGSFYGWAGWSIRTTDGTWGTWNTTSSVPLGPNSFRLLAGNGPPHPDFSAAGAPIRFGYVTDNSFLANQSGLRVGGIDNWSMAVTKVPEPSILALFVTGLGIVVLAHRGLQPGRVTGGKRHSGAGAVPGSL
jgi:hypothetical protein